MKKLENIDLQKKKYFIFDLDGTLIDSNGMWRIIDQRLIYYFCGKMIDLTTLKNDSNYFFLHNNKGNIYLKYCEFLISKYNLNITGEKMLFLRKKISEEMSRSDVKFKLGAAEVVNLLHDMGYDLALATISPKRQIDIYCENKANKQVYDLFDFIITADDIKNKKPYPEIYEKVLVHYQAQPSECLIFEDSLSGVLASKNAGIDVVNVYDMYSENDRVSLDKLSDYYIDDFNEFRNILLNNSMILKRGSYGKKI